MIEQQPHAIHWNENVVILTKFSSLGTAKVDNFQRS